MRPSLVALLIMAVPFAAAPALAQNPAPAPAAPAGEKKTPPEEKPKDPASTADESTSSPNTLVGGPISEVGGPPVELPNGLYVDKRDLSITVGSGFDTYVGLSGMFTLDAARVIRKSDGTESVEHVKKYFHVTTTLSISKSYKDVEGGLTFWSVRLVPVTEGEEPKDGGLTRYTEKFPLQCSGMIPGGYKVDCSIAFRAYNWGGEKQALRLKWFFNTTIQLAAARWLQKVESGAMTGAEPVRINTVAGFSKDLAKNRFNLTTAVFSEERLSYFVKPGSNFAREDLYGWSTEFTIKKLKTSFYFGRTEVRSAGLGILGGGSYQYGTRFHIR
jgi:hypothetical protein